MAKQQLAIYEQSGETLLPTPPIGTIVVWYERNQVRDEFARVGVVMKRESPGQVTLKVFQQGNDRIVSGVQYIEHPAHKNRRHDAVNSGCWTYGEDDMTRYLADGKIPEHHYSFHRDVVKRKWDAQKKAPKPAPAASAS